MINFRTTDGLIKLLILITITSLPLVSQGQGADETAIRQVMNMQTNAWNKGNIEEFMKTYWMSDSLVFIGKSGPKYGYQTTLDNYKKSYPDTTAMGKLTFDLLHVNKLSPQYYHVTGKWSLQRSIGNLGGYFTLLFKKFKNQWLIVSDHSS